ncbi:hypothetical protein PPYR_03015 [Photinus pyralis]|uniref:t-SNARE coiled-coil homology domain-containing protein n=2 Tax=Photinus pyralis TaxID=7054 RepID=A0A5N4A1K5_PHOPY|nr:uncharacterized protein LOC116161944 isoform X1 [Photinus pyralis]XP_031331397.1 uncharacterized protein LOC116162021 isoform X1 [Photinus pyralis]KAB0791214.1 hypothetical protein PPYR_03014 [Photinus pyralis]KAB0791215.1 hypothetical protein PPYR_03015 [Photinus pyralis]
MDENSYEYQCMRAELLGVERPSLDDFLSNQKKRQEAEHVEQEEVDVENLKDVEREGEDFRNMSGGLHELGNILSATQKKLNRFKASCGSLTNLLKIRIGTASGSNESIILNSNSSNANQEVTGLDNTSLADSPKKIAGDDEVRKSDLADALDNHVDKLDLLIENAENCQYSMSEQNKQMKKFLR